MLFELFFECRFRCLRWNWGGGGVVVFCFVLGKCCKCRKLGKNQSYGKGDFGSSPIL